MPYKVKLPNVTRGDVCERAIALTFAGPLVAGKAGPRIPMPPGAVTQLQSTYTLIEAQFKAQDTDTEALISLSSANTPPGLRIEPAYPLPDGTIGPAIVLAFRKVDTAVVIDSAVWDMQFSGPGIGPGTWVYGEDWSVEQDITRTATDAP